MDPYWNFVDAWSEGWDTGYSDVLPDCPYLEGTQEFTDWWDGYRDGSYNS